MKMRTFGGMVGLFCATLALSGCEEGEMQLPDFLQAKPGTTTTTTGATRTVERDVEAPEVFQVVDKGLWDGRPSLGGVWVAHASAKEPERVIIRNQANSKFVVGVLYRPERVQPGPAIQVSSDAAEALGMLAGQPVEISVTALRRQEVAEEDPNAAPAETETPEAPAVQEQPLDPLAAAAAALEEAPEPAPTPQRPAPTSALAKPFIQIGIFSVEANAKNTAESLRRAGMVPTIKTGKMNGKGFWRVIVGPAATSGERAALLKKIKDLGFSDAYYVTN